MIVADQQVGANGAWIIDTGCCWRIVAIFVMILAKQGETTARYLFVNFAF
jgi:hypothetical protein